MYNHYFNEKGEYTLTTVAYEGTIPAPNCVRMESMLKVTAGFWPVVNAAKDGFDLVEDHRGKEGWLDGKRVKVTDVGPLPDDWSDTPPEKPDTRTTDEKRFEAYVLEADYLRDQALSYQLEADACRLDGDDEAAVIAEEKRDTYLRLYRAKKEEIRAKYPNTEEEE